MLCETRRETAPRGVVHHTSAFIVTADALENHFTTVCQSKAVQFFQCARRVPRAPRSARRRYRYKIFSRTIPLPLGLQIEVMWCWRACCFLCGVKVANWHFDTQLYCRFLSSLFGACVTVLLLAATSASHLPVFNLLHLCAGAIGDAAAA